MPVYMCYRVYEMLLNRNLTTNMAQKFCKMIWTCLQNKARMGVSGSQTPVCNNCFYHLLLRIVSQTKYGAIYLFLSLRGRICICFILKIKSKFDNARTYDG